MITKRKEFWITNLSNRIVNIHDLTLFIKPFASVNLLDRRHYAYTIKQLEESATSGSIFRKRDKIFVRDYKPQDCSQENKIEIDMNSNIPSRERSAFVVKEEVYEELIVSDLEFAEENADLTDEVVNTKE